MCVSLCELLVPLGAVWMSGQVSDMRQSTQVYCDALSLRPSLISPHINHPTQAAQGSSGGVLSGDHIVSISTTKRPLIVLFWEHFISPWREIISRETVSGSARRDHGLRESQTQPSALWKTNFRGFRMDILETSMSHFEHLWGVSGCKLVLS